MVLNLKNYIASKEDLTTVEEGIQYVRHQNLGFIFKDKAKINNTAVISYDSKYIYLFQHRQFIKIDHGLTISKKFHSWWRAGLLPDTLKKYLPTSITNKTRFDLPIISGGLLTPFIELQKQKRRLNNPYVTRESYLATIIHEYGHLYYDQYKLWWFSNKEKNLKYLQFALQAFSKNTPPKIALRIPSHVGMNEVFAFCTEYFASKLFFPKHKLNLDKFYSCRIKELIKLESSKNLDQEDSVLDSQPSHDFAAVFGILLLRNSPKNWPKKLTTPGKLH